MLLQLIKNRRNGFILFPVILVGLWLNHLISPYGFSWQGGEEGFLLFGLFRRLVTEDPLTGSLIALVLVALNSMMLFRIYRAYLFQKSWTMLPALLFVMLTSGIAGFQTLHPVWLALPFLTAATDILFGSIDIRKPYSRLFKTGVVLSVGSLFWFPLVFMLPVFMVGGSMMARDARWRESTLLFLGALVPWIFAFSAAFLTDTTPALIQLTGALINTSLPKFGGSIPVMAFAGLTAVLTLAGSARILQRYDQKKVSFRRFYVFFFLLFLSCVLAYVLVPAVTSAIFMIAAVPVTFLLSNYFGSFRRALPAEVIFLLILALALYIQWS